MASGRLTSEAGKLDCGTGTRNALSHQWYGKADGHHFVQVVCAAQGGLQEVRINDRNIARPTRHTRRERKTNDEEEMPEQQQHVER